MTIGEAILHCEERAKADCSECAEEHRQLAEWLSKLQKYEDTGLTPEEIMDGKMLTGWIPVEEGLPEKNATYCLVTTTRSPRIEMAWYLGGDWYWNNSDAKMGGVFAWMPLPEPYRPEALRKAGAEAGQDAAAQVLQPAT